MIVNQLKINPENHPFLMSESLATPKTSREKMTQIMFESFNVPALYIANTALMALFAHGIASGTVLDSGHEITQVASIYEAYTIPQSVQKLEIGGKDVSVYFENLLMSKSNNSLVALEREVLKDLKEKLCYISNNFQEEYTSMTSSTIEKSYQLPDGNLITLGSERFRAPEIIFNPSLLNLETSSFSETITKSISSCDVDIRHLLYSNLIICGGNTLFPQMINRLSTELCKNNAVNIRANPNREFDS